jgi:DNA polymerase-3 subunit gamma/tau
MAYKALYRTYRPSNFHEIAGQEHITKTFQNALKNNKIAHAYLFSGPRGTGKTSIAKIIAKAVNCVHAPTSNPCNECEICKGIDQNTINDVIEIDAASNNGVDEIREIRDKVKYLPGVGQYKVYIIDEVHMLSTGAFNALLKTLEEPPKHVIFILATTEPHKIPATIHSRCQRFDFRGISVKEIIKRLNTIIEEENISIEKEAIKVIAESVEGGMRDAISLLDQVISYTEDKVTVDDVHTIKGTVSNERLLDIAISIKENDSVLAMKKLDELISLGKEAPRLIDNMIQFYRNVLIYKNTNVEEDDQLIFKDERFKELASSLSNNVVFFYIDILNKTMNDMRYTNNGKLFAELALIKLVDPVEKQEIVLSEEIYQLQKEIEMLKEEMHKIELKKPTEEFNFDQFNEIIEEKKEAKEFNTQIEEDDRSDDLTEEDIENDEYDETKEIEEEISEESHEEQSNLFALNEEEDAQENKETTPNLDTVKKEETKQEVEKRDYKTYDIRYIEDILNNADREIKIQMNQRWYDIERFSSNEQMNYAKMITDGRLVATDGQMIIIEYPSASLCNRMMKPSTKKQTTKLLSDYYKREIDYLAIPKEVWEEKSQEFIRKWKNKEKNIKLSPINYPGLKELPKMTEEVEDMQPDSVKDALDMFGDDFVKVKKESKR